MMQNRDDEVRDRSELGHDRKTRAPRLSKVAVVAVILLGTAFGAGVAYAGGASVYKSTSSPIPARTAIVSSQKNHSANFIDQCQIPTFSAAIFLKTTGGSEIRRLNGNCPIGYDFPTENSTTAWCLNRDTAAKYARCKHQWR